MATSIYFNRIKVKSYYLYFVSYENISIIEHRQTSSLMLLKNSINPLYIENKQDIGVTFIRIKAPPPYAVQAG